MRLYLGKKVALVAKEDIIAYKYDYYYREGRYQVRPFLKPSKTKC